jgi:cyanophycin synthetase
MSLPFVSDSRRLTGASMVLPVPGAILEVAAPIEHKIKLRVLWRNYARKLLDRIGWERESVITRDQGASQILAISAPIDALLAATYLTEWAWSAALVRLDLYAADEVPSLARISDTLLSKIADSANPRLRVLHHAAQLRGVTALLEKEFSLGEGEHCKVYPLDDLPLPDEIAWRPKRRQLPIALITGTNGKTTTTRLVARMVREAGIRAGFCSTDYVQIGAEILQRDDYSGPTGARLVLRHPNTQLAVLEVARGGMLRRGLQVKDADVGLVTNVADDHLGENGIHTLDQLAEAKFTITRGLAPDAPLIVNADDRHCRALARRLERSIYWFGLAAPTRSMLKGRRARAGLVYVDQDHVLREQDDELHNIIAVNDIAIGLQGAARYNIANALAAIAVASVLKLPLSAIRSALREFGKSPEDNPGRANVYAIRGATVIADYGHNPEGIDALLKACWEMPAKRRLVVVGLAGDRSNTSAEQIGASLAALKPDRVIVKELASFLRGRPEGELSGILRTSLRQNGLAAARMSYTRTDSEALEQALTWLRPGDLAVVFLHEDKAALGARLAELAVIPG